MKLILVISYNNKKVIVAEIKFGEIQFGNLTETLGLETVLIFLWCFIFKLNRLGKILKIKIHYDSRLIYRQLQILKY